jgi:hypothetical protein
MEFTSGDQIVILSQHIIDKHLGKMYLPYEIIKNDFKIIDEAIMLRPDICTP